MLLRCVIKYFLLLKEARSLKTFNYEEDFFTDCIFSLDFSFTS